MKDNFSTRSSDYARSAQATRPRAFRFFVQNCRAFDTASRCPTGNGQIAAALTVRFRRVIGTDISQNQLANALQCPNVEYRLEPAESSSLPENSLDLITVGQAAHWFDFDRFYPEVRRVLRPGGLLALVGYHLLKVDEPTDEIIHHLYRSVLGNYWDAERRYVDAAYAQLPFPLTETAFPEMMMTYDWTRAHLLGYLGTWSAVQHFTKQNGCSPIDEALTNALQQQ